MRSGECAERFNPPEGLMLFVDSRLRSLAARHCQNSAAARKGVLFATMRKRYKREKQHRQKLICSEPLQSPMVRARTALFCGTSNLPDGASQLEKQGQPCAIADHSVWLPGFLLQIPCCYSVCGATRFSLLGVASLANTNSARNDADKTERCEWADK